MALMRPKQDRPVHGPGAERGPAVRTRRSCSRSLSAAGRSSPPRSTGTPTAGSSPTARSTAATSQPRSCALLLQPGEAQRSDDEFDLGDEPQSIICDFAHPVPDMRERLLDDGIRQLVVREGRPALPDTAEEPDIFLEVSNDPGIKTTNERGTIQCFLEILEEGCPAFRDRIGVERSVRLIFLNF